MVFPSAEHQRLDEDARRAQNWKRWGTYLAERQWGTVREDYSADGDAWRSFPHDHARSRAYRWGEDGLLGWTDRECRLCFGLALWNGHDPLLKERLFGLTNPEGNHGEDVKEAYYYIAATPTHSYCRGLYKYPQAAYPYDWLIEENARRGRDEREFEIHDTGIFDQQRYFDVFVEYAKAAPDDTLIRITVENRGPEASTLHVLPQLWFRNTWRWRKPRAGDPEPPRIEHAKPNTLRATHATLGVFELNAETDTAWLFTGNETNAARLFHAPNATPFVKDAFHRFVVNGETAAVNPAGTGTKAAAHYILSIPAKGNAVVRLRLRPESDAAAFADFEEVMAARLREAGEFYETRLAPGLSDDQRMIVCQAYAGLLWTKQFYHYVVKEWAEGDTACPPPPPGHAESRNGDWQHLYNSDVISVPDKWEYPWYAAWDLAFHMIPCARVDPDFAKSQLLLLLREWYMHPNGQIPAYEWNLRDVNPPVHAWACWRVYKISAPPGRRDSLFLERCFQKLLLNFTWWVNRKDVQGRHVFAGGFLGLDNVGLFDRSKPLPGGQSLAQADGTAWMAFYCGTMLGMALELAQTEPAYEDIASKFFEHFVQIVDAMNAVGDGGLWDETDGFYYDQLLIEGKKTIPLRVRSMVGIIPLLAVEVLDQELVQKLPGFRKRLRWFVKNRFDLARHISYMERTEGADRQVRRLLAIPSRDRLLRVLRFVLDEREFLSPFGIRSLSRIYENNPYTVRLDGEEHCIAYEPAESRSGMFGGNSNWRGPVWLPLNYLLIEALERYHHFYGDELRVECPTGSGKMRTLQEVAHELAARLASIFSPDARGCRPCFGDNFRYATDPHWRDYVLFHEYFHGEIGCGLGANHQTGWTALIARCFGILGRISE
jgi:hypothetical protein